MIKKAKGFTLVEVLLVVGVISLATMKIFEFQNRKIVTAAVERQADNLEIITDNITSSLVDVSNGTANLATNIATITTNTAAATLATSGAIPKDMVNGLAIQNVWGGPVLISGANVGGTPGFQMSFGAIPTEACVKFATNEKVVKTVQSITINGANVRGVGAVSPNVGQVVAACQLALNVIVFTHDLVHPMKYDPVKGAILSPNYMRPRETKYNIAPTSTSVTTLPLATPVCNGGSIWNAAISSCTCPGTTQWTGSRCGTEGSNTLGNAGLCPLGQAWNPATNVCFVLPARAAKTITNPWVGTQFSPSVTVTTTRYGNRMIPNNVATTAQYAIATPPNETAAQCAAIPNGRWNGRSCDICLVKQNPTTGAATPGAGVAGMGVWSTDRCTTN